MRLHELKNIPHIYLDMDGVQADFFTAWARIHGVNKYKEIGNKEEREASIRDLISRGTDFIQSFFSNLDPLPGGTKLVSWLKKHDIPFTILSAPLRNPKNAEFQKGEITPKMASKLGKKVWLDKHNPGTSSSAIFDGMKERYAVTTQPNILIDDYKNHLEKWTERGGIGILYRDDRVDDVIKKLIEIYGINSPEDPQ